MAISASKTKEIQTGWNLTASFEETGTSVANNTSNISCTARLAPKTSAYYFDYTGAGTLAIYWHDNRTNSDTLVASATKNASSSSSNAVVSGSITATHKDDGTLSGYAKAVWTKKYNSGYIPATGNVSTDTKALTTIARKSVPTLSMSSINIPASSGSITVTTNRASSSFTHTITMTIGSTEIARQTNVGASVTFAIPDLQDDIFTAIPSAKTATITTTCETFNGSTSLGTNSVTFTANVTNDARPTFSDFSYSDTNSTTAAITGNNQVLISGKSTLTATISAAQKATANYHATMSQYSFTINSQTQTQAYTTAAITKNLGAVTISGTANQAKDLVVAALDSRGLNKSVTKTVTVVAYNTPQINATATRLNGFENTTTIATGGLVSPILVGGVGKNTVNTTSGLQYRYKAQNTTTWSAWTNVACSYNATTGAVTAANFSLNLDNQTAYDFQFQLTDALETGTASLTVSPGQPSMYIGADDKRVSIGGMPTIAKVSGKAGQLEVLGNAYANGNRLAELPIATSDLSGTISSSQIASKAVTNAKLDWSTLCSPTNDTSHTTLANTYTKFYTCSTHIRSAFGGHGFDFSALLDFGGSSGSATINMTAIPGKSGWYGFKTQEKVPITPSAAMVYDATGRAYAYVPGSDPGARLRAYARWIAFAIGTDGYIYVNASTTQGISIGSWERIQWNIYGGIHLIDK